MFCLDIPSEDLVLAALGCKPNSYYPPPSLVSCSTVQDNNLFNHPDKTEIKQILQSSVLLHKIISDLLWSLAQFSS